MALDNLISVQFTQDEVNTINEAIASLEKVLSGKVVNITPDERRQYGRISDRNKVFVDKVKGYMTNAPQTIPQIIDTGEFNRDYDARTAIEQPLRKLTMILEKLQDTKTLLDFDNYNATLAYYRYVKFLAGQNEPGTTTIYQDLKQHYKGGRSKTETTETTE